MQCKTLKEECGAIFTLRHSCFQVKSLTTELIELVGELMIKLAAGRNSFNALYDLGSEIWTQWRVRRYHLNCVDWSFVDDGRRSGRGDKVLEGPLLWPVVVC